MACDRAVDSQQDQLDVPKFVRHGDIESNVPAAASEGAPRWVGALPRETGPEDGSNRQPSLTLPEFNRIRLYLARGRYVCVRLNRGGGGTLRSGCFLALASLSRKT